MTRELAMYLTTLIAKDIESTTGTCMSFYERVQMELVLIEENFAPVEIFVKHRKAIEQTNPPAQKVPFKIGEITFSKTIEL